MLLYLQILLFMWIFKLGKIIMKCVNSNFYRNKKVHFFVGTIIYSIVEAVYLPAL